MQRGGSATFHNTFRRGRGDYDPWNRSGRSREESTRRRLEEVETEDANRQMQILRWESPSDVNSAGGSWSSEFHTA